MIDLSVFYSAKMAGVFILMLSSTTLEAQQQNENGKFFDLMAAIGEHFGGEFNEAEKALELNLNGANSFLERLHQFATHKIVRKNENGEFECKEFKKPDFEMAIKTILGKDMRNLEKVLRVKYSRNELHTLSTILGEKLKPNEKVEDLIKELSEFSDAQLFNLLFSLAARLEALVHGKNIDGTLQETEENSKEKIQAFLALPKCFILPESKLSIFDYWIEIIKMKTKNSQEPIFGVAIYREKYDKNQSEDSKEEAFRLSQENYNFLKLLNDQKFSIYESTNILREIFNRAYYRRKPTITDEKIPGMFRQLLDQIQSVFVFNWEEYIYFDNNYKCAYAMLLQNISESLMKMMRDKGIDPELHLDSQDFKIREYVQKEVKERCKKFDNEEAKIIFLNNVHYELAIHFEFNQRKDVYDRADDLMFNWLDNIGQYRSQRKQLTEDLYLKKNAEFMLSKIKHFTSEKTNRETISIIEALIGKEHIDQFNLGALFDQMKTLVEVTPEEEANIAEENRKHLKPNNLTEQARTLAKTFEKMLENVKEHYAQKVDESNDGEEMIISD